MNQARKDGEAHGGRHPREDSARDHPKRAAIVWFGVLGGGAAWLLHLLVSFWTVPFVCARDAEWILHAFTAGFAAIAGLAVASALSARRRGIGFPALSGILLSTFFLFLILFEGLPVLLQGDPCAAVPTIDRPIIFYDSAPRHLALLMIHPEGLVAPGELWAAWNWDLPLLLPIYLLTLLYLAGIRRLWRSAGQGHGVARWRVGAYLGGIAALVVALFSPIDAAGGTLFSIHMVQHMLLMVVAAPLLILGRPVLGYLWALPAPGRRRVGGGWHRFRPGRAIRAALGHPLLILFLHIAALWIWHVPSFYEAALRHPVVHHLEHASFFLTAMLFWWVLAESAARGLRSGYAAGILYVFATALQSSALGALLLFADTPWFPAHTEGATLWQIDLLVDQQVAGAIMWIPAGLAYTAAMVALFVGLLRNSERTVTRRERAGWVAVGSSGRTRGA